MGKKKRIAIIVGGPSQEYEISLKTGEMVEKNLDKKKFNAFKVKIEKDGRWPITIEKLKERADIAFVAMHGKYGEDGQIQSLLETFQIPYTGSNPVASALAMDKIKTMDILQRHGYFVPEYFTAQKNNSALKWDNVKKINLPAIIKPVDGGSSVGISVIRSWSELPQALAKVFQCSDSAIIQRYIAGKELSCGILEINNSTIPLLPTEIIPCKANFFDYQSKYEDGGSREITPPKLPKPLIKKIQQAALGAHKMLGCSGMSRTDMILGTDENLHILELNTIPGLTETSLLPQAAEKMGINFPKLLEIIIDSANKNG